MPPRPLGAALLALLLPSIPAAAGSIDIGFTQLDLVYDGETIATEGDADKLGAITIAIDGEVVESYLGGTIEIELPGVPDLLVGGETVVTGQTGWLMLRLPTLETVELSLDNVVVNYLDTGAFGQFAFGGTVAEVQDQTLPEQFRLDPEASVLFSASVSDVVDDGVNVVSFKASGTGQVRGALLVPEPTTAAAVGLCFMFAMAAAAMRSKLG